AHRRYAETGAVKERSYRRNRFRKRYTAGDIELLAEADEAHETLSGAATRKSSNGSSLTMAIRATSAWRGFRRRIFTTCARAGGIARSACGTRRRGRYRFLLASGGAPTRKASRVTCV
ncbi:MAG: hypothetical protein ACRD4O_10590, partial [Bryobacteraceae bacterium]